MNNSPMIRRKLSTQGIMTRLSCCLMIVFVFGLYNTSRYGLSFVTNGIICLALSLGIGVALEAVYALIRKENPVKYISHSFCWITSLIIVLALPVNTKPYVVAIATAVSIVSKLIFGGFGKNIFNPAALGRFAALYFFPGVVVADAIASPTIASRMSILNWVMDSSTLSRVVNAYGGVPSLLMGTYFGAFGETGTLLILLCGIYLIFADVIDWRIPVTYLGTIFLGGTIVSVIKGISLVYPLVLISTGGVAFAAVFMLTDPVTNPNSSVGKIIYASVAAMITIGFRLFSSYPEGAVISILIVNILTVLLNKLFDTGKTIDHEKRDAILACSFVLMALVFITGSIMITKPGEIVDRKDNNGNKEDVVMYNFADAYADYAAQVEVDGNIYHVSVKGYGTLDHSLGGMGGNGDYSNNQFDIEIENGKVKSITVVHFGDTKGVGDSAMNDEYFFDFIGQDINGQIDAYTGASYTSKSLIAAVAAALQAAQ